MTCNRGNWRVLSWPLRYKWCGFSQIKIIPRTAHEWEYLHHYSKYNKQKLFIKKRSCVRGLWLQFLFSNTVKYSMWNSLVQWRLKIPTPEIDPLYHPLSQATLVPTSKSITPPPVLWRVGPKLLFMTQVHEIAFNLLLWYKLYCVVVEFRGTPESITWNEFVCDYKNEELTW